MTKLYWVNIYCDNGRIIEHELEGNSLEEIEDKVLELTGGDNGMTMLILFYTVDYLIEKDLW